MEGLVIFPKGKTGKTYLKNKTTEQTYFNYRLKYSVSDEANTILYQFLKI